MCPVKLPVRPQFPFPIPFPFILLSNPFCLDSELPIRWFPVSVTTTSTAGLTASKAGCSERRATRRPGEDDDPLLPHTHQADEAEAAVAVDENLARLAITLEEPLEVLLRDIGRQVAHEEAAALRVRLLARLEEALNVDGEAHLLVRALVRGRGRGSGWRGLPSQHERHGGRRLALPCRRFKSAQAGRGFLNSDLLQVSPQHHRRASPRACSQP